LKIQTTTLLTLLTLLTALTIGACSKPDRGARYDSGHRDDSPVSDGDDAGTMTTSPASGGGSSSGSTPTSALRVFVTSLEVPADLGGAPGADELCQASADAAELGGNYRAWLSTSSTPAPDRILGEGPWINLAGRTVFNNRANLRTTPAEAIELTEHGTPLPFGALVWTGTEAGGFPSSEDCYDWSDDYYYSYGRVGSALSSTSGWTDYTTENCDQRAHLYCFEI
jgi:hypothetical protein